MAPTSTDLQTVIELLPDNAESYGWDTSKVLERWAGTVYRTVREFWVDRTNDTAGYIDLSGEGLPASQLHSHAKAMLVYWDDMITKTEAEAADSALSRTRKIRMV